MAWGRGRWVTQLSSHEHVVQLIEWSCRMFQVNNFLGFSLLPLIEYCKSAENEKMGNISLCAVICCPPSQGLTQGDLRGHEGSTRGGSPSLCVVRKWDILFKHGRERWVHKDWNDPFSQAVLTCSIQLTETEILKKPLTLNFLHNHSNSWTARACNKKCVTRLLLH